jgi:serine phosphatase RsbU (regulator of sigma subunit)
MPKNLSSGQISAIVRGMDSATRSPWYKRNRTGWMHFQSLPFRRQLPLLLAVFSLFTVIGFFVDLMGLGHTPYVIVLASAISSGIISIVYLIFATRYPTYYTLALTVLQLLYWFGFGYSAAFLSIRLNLQPVPTGPGVRFAAIAIFAAVILSYIMFIGFIRGEGQEAIRIKNELQLAHGIQETLVPQIHLHTAQFELYGRSDPSDKVGGDLVDALQLEDGSSVAYVADIAGHGLQAGILMGMLKTAARTALLDAAHTEPSTVLPVLMERLNRVLPSVKEPQMYATFAGFRLNPDGSVFYALAAHPPLLHYRTHEAQQPMEQLSAEQFPLGLLPVSGFTSDVTMMAPGDLLIAVTDGILEACNKTDEEFGLERLQHVIAENCSASLPALSDAILHAARAFGKQIDDQTLLLVRRL